MPRRPRPSSRAAPKLNVKSIVTHIPSKPSKEPLASPDQSEQSERSNSSEVVDKSATSSDEVSVVDAEDDEDTEDDEDVDAEDDEDVDAPRVSHWVDDDDLDPDSFRRDESTLGQTRDAGPSKLNSLEHDLSNLPLGALLKAQRALKQVDHDESSEDDAHAEPESTTSKGKQKEKVKPEWSTQPRQDIAKRANKHAPTEVTSKRPVTRRRTVVEVKTIQPRDPRFLPLAGQFLPEKFQEHYGFLVDAHKKELQTLRDNLKTARKRLLSSPRELRSEREAEVGRLEMAVKRAESLVNQDRRAKVDREALAKLNEAERAKQKEGKTAWWMKESEKKKFLVRARYDALAADGGKRAVRKAIEKKQKKIGQKEKRSRPFAKDLKRKAGDGEGGPLQKRRRT